MVITGEQNIEKCKKKFSLLTKNKHSYTVFECSQFIFTPVKQQQHLQQQSNKNKNKSLEVHVYIS